MKKCADQKPLRPAQSQPAQPGLQSEMEPPPQSTRAAHKGSDKLRDKVALITGGDSGIGRAVAVAFAREGAKVVIAYLSETGDAHKARDLVEAEGQPCLLAPGDLKLPSTARDLVAAATAKFGRLDILVNNAAVQFPTESIADLRDDHLNDTFAVNILAMFHLAKFALPSLRKHRGSSIINTTSVTAYRGSKDLVDYAATKGAIVAFTRSLALQLADDGVRVNAVAPGPVWTPLIPATFPPDRVATFGSDVPLKRAAEPAEVAPAYVFLASDDGSYVTGQVLHVNGGEVVNG